MRQHLEHDHPDDRTHLSAASVVAGVAGVSQGDGLRLRLATELVVLASQHLDESSPWVRIEATEHAGPTLALSPETMRRVLLEVSTLVDDLPDS